MAILGIKTWKMENIAENDRKEGIRTRQGFGELKFKSNTGVPHIVGRFLTGRFIRPDNLIV